MGGVKDCSVYVAESRFYAFINEYGETVHCWTTAPGVCLWEIWRSKGNQLTSLVDVGPVTHFFMYTSLFQFLLISCLTESYTRLGAPLRSLFTLTNTSIDFQVRALSHHRRRTSAPPPPPPPPCCARTSSITFR